MTNTINTIVITTDRYAELLEAEIRYNIIINAHNADDPFAGRNILDLFKEQQTCRCKCGSHQQQSAAANKDC